MERTIFAMYNQSHDKSRATQKSGSRAGNRKGDMFLIHKCPTPGCSCRSVKPRYNKEEISGFTCANGCVYRAKVNSISGEIDCFELIRSNPYKVDPDIGNYRVTPEGIKYVSWIW